CLQYSITPFTF
nr:immunoglobulin light chain junction region [Macaca mulatta]MOW08389.1 immunoglobulin light chain junction region [Macaca mulatta]MOW08597.1 immunoglobulin light chain junction region [Macaca mulatta]MOW08723.1 immunoglobulin light chain junction region [Macaca mulatta]MOW09543.1 immunoglobulin light chain junction region [Macaca mulatta]